MERDLRRDRGVILGTLGVLLAASWAFLLAGAGMGMSAWEMTRMESSQMIRVLAGAAQMRERTSAPWTIGTVVLMFVMWWVMMAAMMLPGAIPMVGHFAALSRRNEGAPYLASGLFTLGYLLIWAGFSAAAVALQWVLEETDLLSPMLVVTSGVLDEFLLLGAGVYQFLPLQRRFLEDCRNCCQVLADGWRAGPSGAVVTGLEHGIYCLGCTGPLMTLLFLAGVMNLYWIAGLALIVLLEKAAPRGVWISRATGLALIAWALWRLAAEQLGS